MKSEEEKRGERSCLRERRYGSFVRSVSLPMPVKADAVEADYHNGVLTLTLPKTDEVKPKRIAIKSGGHTPRVLDNQATRS